MSSTGSDKPDAFDARVERAWRFVRAMFFTPHEHAMCGEALVQRVSKEQASGQSPDTRPRCP